MCKVAFCRIAHVTALVFSVINCCTNGVVVLLLLLLVIAWLLNHYCLWLLLFLLLMWLLFANCIFFLVFVYKYASVVVCMKLVYCCCCCWYLLIVLFCNVLKTFIYLCECFLFRTKSVSHFARVEYFIWKSVCPENTYFYFILHYYIIANYVLVVCFSCICLIQLNKYT